MIVVVAASPPLCGIWCTPPLLFMCSPNCFYYDTAPPHCWLMRNPCLLLWSAGPTLHRRRFWNDNSFCCLCSAMASQIWWSSFALAEYMCFATVWQPRAIQKCMKSNHVQSLRIRSATKLNEGIRRPGHSDEIHHDGKISKGMPRI